MSIDWLRGCATALITPFKDNGDVDEDRMRKLVERQLDNGVSLLVPCGTTGESATMSEEEDTTVIKITIDIAKGRGKVIAGAGSNNTQSAIKYSRTFRDVGADALLLVSPYYNKPTQEGLYAHFKAIADAVSDIPLVLYNVPGRTSSNIEASTVIRLAHDVKNIVAIKEASGNLSQIMTILRERPDGFRVLSGDDAITLPIIALGGDGVISVVSNEVPDLMSKMVNLALDGQLDKARDLHYQLLPLMEGNFIETSPGPVKAALALMGLIEETLRLPLVPVQDRTRTKMKEILTELGLLKGTSNVTA
jgi:4-hydroxy-tetrahydrodipicolinate synthase